MFTIPRITKDPQVRQTELMNAAQELFLSKGYLQTTVQDIVRKIDVAQGTFYYYFTSKESILESIIAQHVRTTLAKVQSSELAEADALEKLQLFVNLFYKLCYQDEPRLLTNVLYRENQGLLINRIWRLMLTLTTPLLLSILEQCNREGVTHVTLMEETLAFFNGIIAALLESGSPLKYGHETDPQIIRNKVKIAEKLIETLFDAPAGSIRLTSFCS